MTEIYEDDTKEQDDCSLTNKDFEDLAKTYINMFFRKKLDNNGCEIDTEELYTERNISLVLNLSICDGMSLIYGALSGRKEPKRKGKLPEDVQLVLKLLNECSKLSMPKPCAAGLILLYLEVCEGYDISV